MSATPVSEPDARALADAIQQISHSGQGPAEALKLVEMALARAPQHPLVLNAAAAHMLRSGDAARARELYVRAIALDSNSKVLWFNLAAACRFQGDLQAEEDALNHALAIEPRYVMALLQKGDLNERRGNAKAAAMMYTAALDSIASGAPAPANMGPAINHAHETVRANAQNLEKFLEEETRSVRERYGAAELRGADACRDVYLRKRQVFTSSPKEMLFPYLPSLEFFEREDFPWLDALEAATEDIAEEAVAALQSHREEFKPYVDFPPGTPIDQWTPLNHSMDWSVYSLWHDGEPIPLHQAQCPRTSAVLAKLPMCDIPGYAPGAFFSVLKPRTRLPPHTGTTNTRSIVHLPLVIPEGCGFRVGSDVRQWKKGKAWVFDDSIDHEAWNDSDETRIILIFDIWNPLLSEASRDMVRALTIGVGRYYGADAPALRSQ